MGYGVGWQPIIMHPNMKKQVLFQAADGRAYKYFEYL